MGIGRPPTRPARPTSVGTGSGLARHRQELTHKRPAYKVVYEQVTQQKKKLDIQGTIQAAPPAGYTFLPAGNPTMTKECKEYARLAGATIFTVTGSSRKNPRNPGNEKNGFAKFTQRIGYQFPSWVVDKVKIKLGIHESTPDTARLNTATHKSGQDRKPKPSDRKHTRAEQNKLDEEAREALKDLFPFIPKKDTNAIVKHAFDLTSDRVGTQVADLSIARRVQLAVIAHIRHVYTDYDKLLKEIPWQAARQTVQDATLLKCSEWRGEEGSDDADDAMEDILREVIVISEDEDETDGPHDRLHPRRVDDDEASVIVLDEMETHPINYGALNEEDLQKVMSPEPNDNITFQALGNGQYVISHNDPARDEKNSARRLRTWAETRGRFRRPPQEPEVVYELDPQQPVQRYDRSMRVLVPESVPIGRRDSPRGMARQERTAMTCIPLPRRDFNSGSSILQGREPLRTIPDHYEIVTQPRPIQPPTDYASRREVGLAPINAEKYHKGRDTRANGLLPSRQLFPVTEAFKDTAFPSIEASPQSTRFREHEVIVISSPIHSPKSMETSMIQNYRDDLPAPSNKRRLGEINDEKRPQKRMSQDYAGTSTSHQAMHGVYQPLKRQPELDRPFATETREAVGAPKPSRIAVENHHPDAMWHRQLTNNPNTPMYSHAQIPLSPSWLPSRHAAAATSRHDIVTLSSGDTPIVSNAIVSTMHAPQQYMTTSSYRELPRDSHPRQNGDRDSDRVLLKRPLYEDRDLREGQYYQQGSLYSEPIRSERPPNFHPAMKEQYPLGQRERRPLPLDSGLENGWVNPKPMALERPEAVPVVMRTITNSVHKQDGRTRDAVHAPVHYYSQPSRAYPPMDDRFPAQREAIRRDDRRMIEASQYHVAEATSDRRDNRMETQRAVRVPVARKEVRVVIDRETGREVFLVD